MIQTGRELAGFENWRTKVYSSSIVKSFNAKFLPQLVDSDLWVENQDLEEFSQEIRLLLDNVKLISKNTGYNSEVITHRLNDILQATKKAKTRNYGVVIS